MIDPRTKKDGEDYSAYCRRRWGGDGWTYSLRDRGKKMGLIFGSWTWWPNTFNAHRLCTYLEQLDAGNSALTQEQKEQRGLELVKKFYELTYERGANISTPEGAAIALDELGYAKASDAVQWLQKGGGQTEVAESDSFAKTDMDIHGVPYFVIGEPGAKQPYGLSGAQSSSAFTQTFRKIAG